MRRTSFADWLVLGGAIATLSVPVATSAQVRSEGSDGDGTSTRSETGLSSFLGQRYRPGPVVGPFPRHQRQPGINTVRDWNQIAVDASGLDHTPVGPGGYRVYGEQRGPCRSSRAMAIAHIAIFDVVNAVVGGYRGYTQLERARGNTSVNAAVAQAAHDTLAALFPSQGNVRPLLPRSFSSLSQAEDENGQSRICLGIHWRFDKDWGIAQGRQVGDYVFENTLLPVKHPPGS